MARAKASTVPAAIEGQAMGIIRRVKMRRSDQAQRARGVEHLRIERLKGTKRRAVHERKLTTTALITAAGQVNTRAMPWSINHLPTGVA